MKRSKAILLAPFLLGALSIACDDAAIDAAHTTTTAASSAEPVGGLTPEQAGKVVAKVGDKTITLGDFARTLDRMDPFDRLRFQTKERRRELLSEMIDVELLAQEARRRGLDKKPEVEDALRQLYRDALLQKMRDSLPPPAGLTAEEVKAYYDANADRYTEPERRRVSAIVVANKADADKVLKLAAKVKTAQEWGELFQKNSITAPKAKGANDPVDLAGDLGIVGPPDDPKGGNLKVPDAVRKVAFQLQNKEQIADAAVEAEGKFYIVRLSGITAGHKRTLQEADRSIRVAILQQRLADMEKKLDEELRAKFPVQVDEKALADIKLPTALVDAATTPSPWAKDAAAPSPSADASAAPSSAPSADPSAAPSVAPSGAPSALPTGKKQVPRDWPPGSMSPQ
ncbi:MAG: peptidylprolyl isomerase [Polyangiaceae bacterium]